MICLQSRIPTKTHVYEPINATMCFFWGGNCSQDGVPHIACIAMRISEFWFAHWQTVVYAQLDWVHG